MLTFNWVTLVFLQFGAYSLSFVNFGGGVFTKFDFFFFFGYGYGCSKIHSQFRFVSCLFLQFGASSLSLRNLGDGFFRVFDFVVMVVLGFIPNSGLSLCFSLWVLCNLNWVTLIFLQFGAYSLASVKFG